MPTLMEILRDPNYINANEATKRAIFDRYAPQDSNYSEANPATQFAIQQRFGVAGGVAALKPEEDDQSVLREIADVPLKITQGGVMGIRMLADAFGANTEISKTLRSAEDYLSGLMSAQAKKDEREIARIMKSAEDAGVAENVVAAVRAFSVAPVDMLSSALGTAAPAIVAALGAKLLGAGAAVGMGVSALTGAGMGAGTIKGTIYEATKNTLLEAGASEKEAEAKAIRAQEYGGKNLDQILLGTVIGAGAALGPLESGASKLLAKKILGDAAKKTVEEGVEQVTQEAAKSALRRRLGAGVAEAVPEMLQAGQEKVAENIALQREGFDVPTFRGAVGAGVLEGLAGFGLGATIGGGAPEVAPAPAVDTEKETEEKPAGLDVNSPAFKKKVQRYEKAVERIQELEALGDNITSHQKGQLKVATKKAATLKAEIDEALAQAGEEKRVSEGEQDAERTEPATTGEGFEISEFTAPAGPPAGVEGAPSSGVDLTGAPAGTATTGAPREPAALTSPPPPTTTIPAAQVPVTPAVAAPAPTAPAPIAAAPAPTPAAAPALPPATQPVTVTTPAPPPAVKVPVSKTDAESDLDFLDSLDDDTLKSAGRTRRTDAQIEIDNKLDEMGRKYGLERKDDESSNGFKARLRNAAVFAKDYVEEGKVEEAPLQEVAKQELKEEKPYLPPQEQRVLYEETAEAFNAGIDEEAKRVYDETYQDALDDGRSEEEAKKSAEQAAAGYQDDKLPKYRELDDKARRVYFQNNIQKNDQLEHDRAAVALSDYLAGTRRVQVEEQEVAARDSYNRERKAAREKTSLAYEFPAWTVLSDESKRLYKNINKGGSALEIDTAFRAIKEQIRKEKREEQARLAVASADSEAGIQYRQTVKTALKNQPTGKGAALSEDVMDNLLKGNLGAALDTLSRSASGLKGRKVEEFFPVKGPKGTPILRKKGVTIRDSIAQQVFQGLSATLNSVPDFKVNVVVDDNMVGVDTLGEYDAKTNTIYLSKNGRDESTLLHELVHAATVRIINQYFTDKSKLTPRQIEAVEHLQKVASMAEKQLGNKHPNAFDNLYEFVAYAMTDLGFQNDLANTQIAGAAKVTKGAEALSTEVQEEREMFVSPPPYMNTLWDYFTNTLAYLYKIFTPKSRTTEILMPTELSRVTTKSAEQIQREAERKKKREAEKAKVAEEGEETEEVPSEIKIKAQKGELFTKYGVTNLRKSILREPGMRGNVLLEVSAAFQSILAAPEGGIERLAGKEGIDSRLQAKAPTKTKKAPAVKQKTDEEFAEQIVGELKPRERGAKAFAKRLITGQGYEWLAQKFQNQQRVIKRIYDRAERFGIVKRVGEDLNDVWGQLSRATGMALDLYSVHMEPKSKRVQDGIDAYAKKKGIDLSEALARLHAVFESRHEGERRHIKFLLNIPLDKITQYTIKGFNDVKNKPLKMSADGWREYILKEVSRPDLASTAKGREARAKQLRALLEQIVSTPSMHDALVKAKEPTRFDETASFYNVIGDRPHAEIQRMKKVFDLAEDKKELDEIGDALQEVHKETVKLNQMGNYWSIPVQNVVNFYGYKNYVPFKGRSGKTSIDDDFELDSRKIGGELQDYQESFEGRKSESENPILQSLAEGAAAAMRAGRKDLTLAIKNAINDNILSGTVKEKAVKFEDRYLKGQTKKELGGRNRIFHYNEDGTIDVLELKDFTQLEAIRRLFRESTPIWDRLNTITGTIGQTHTRYNPSFAPMNFTRDSFTNAFLMGSQMGPTKAGRFIKAVAADVTEGAQYKALKFSVLYGRGKFAEIEKLAGGKAPYTSLNEDQRYYRDILDYVKLGGKVSYLQGIAAKGALDALMDEVGKSGIAKTKAQVDKFFDIYNDIFELSARTSAYRVMKGEFQAQGEDAESAKVHAVEYTKNLANFEQVGEWGKKAGALFMFFRPAATGAVRAIDALRPAFESINEDEFTARAKSEGRTPEQISKALTKAREERNNARWMSAILTGAGMAMYAAAYAMAGNDEEKRNRVATDDMARWGRYARFFIPGYEQPFQIPWGFGPGAFAAAGAQLAALYAPKAKATLGDALGNMMLIGLESFLPIPFSRINPLDNFPAFVVDSMTPSVVRPFTEYVMNLDGLGREIYNNRQTRYGDAYTGGDNIPEIYKTVARFMFNKTDGGVDISPNTLYFFANNFADGFAKIASTTANLGMSIMGTKEFDPKNDLFVLSSFIGAKSNVDAREFSKAEQHIKEIAKRLNSLEDKPQAYERYVKANPEHEDIVDTYNKLVNRQLRDLRAEANEVRADASLTPRQRKAKIDQIINVMNGAKREILEELKYTGYKP